MNTLPSDSVAPRRIVAAISCCVLAAGCASAPTGNAPPAVVEECRMEVERLTDASRLPPVDESPPEQPGDPTQTIEDARLAQDELEESGLENWPEEALLYRCFTSRGVVLTEEQASVLAEWQSRTDTNDPD